MSYSPTQIVYELGACAFGPILAARSRHGLCAVLLGEPHEWLIVSLKKQFPRRDCVPGFADLRRVIHTVDDPELHYAGDLDPQGSEFQKMVWDEIRAVPHAHTVTYGWLAEAVGKPKGVRAVAQACGANPVAVIIPCHRIVGKNTIGDYRWGVEIKKKLLEIEAASTV